MKSENRWKPGHLGHSKDYFRNLPKCAHFCLIASIHNRHLIFRLIFKYLVQIKTYKYLD